MKMWRWDGSVPIIFTVACKNTVQSAHYWAHPLPYQWSLQLIQCISALTIFYPANKGLCGFYQHCNAPSEGFLSGNGGGSEGLCTVSYQIYSSCSGILLADRFWIRHLPKCLESHFLHRCFTGEQTPFDSKIGNARSCNCSGSYRCNIVKLHTAVLSPPIIYQAIWVKRMCYPQKRTSLLYPQHLHDTSDRC